MRANRNRRRALALRLGVVPAAAAAALFMAGTALAAPGAQAGRGAQVSQPSWHLQNPPAPSGSIVSYINGVSCSDASHCLAVGSVETNTSLNGSFAESWNGSAWTLLTPPDASDTTLYAVTCLSATDCLVVGDEYTASFPLIQAPLAEVWNGSTWTALSPIAPKKASHAALTGVACPSATHCMAVGWSYHYQTARSLLAETLTGSTWKLRTTPEPSGATKSQFNAVSCASATSCAAVGYEFAPADDMLAEGWNGEKWTLQSTPAPSGATESDFTGVSCPAAACTAVGYYYTDGDSFPLAEAWNGTAWTQQSTPSPADSSFGGVTCPSADMCVVVGATGGSEANTGTSLAEFWNGSAWAVDSPGQPSGAVLSFLSSVSCPSAADCTAGGAQAPTTNGNLVPFAAQYN
jgi:hypothetical protein